MPPIYQLLSEKIQRATYERQMLGMEPSSPRFIYLGRVEHAACLAMMDYEGVILDRTLSYGGCKFMGVKVLSVPEIETHIEVSF